MATHAPLSVKIDPQQFLIPNNVALHAYLRGPQVMVPELPAGFYSSLILYESSDQFCFLQALLTTMVGAIFLGSTCNAHHVSPVKDTIWPPPVRSSVNVGAAIPRRSRFIVSPE